MRPGRTLATLVACWATMAQGQDQPPVAPMPAAAAFELTTSATRRRALPQVIRDIRSAVALGPTVAVIDTGANVSHSDFNGRIAPGAYEVFNRTSDTTDTQGHGTAVASMVVAQQGMSSALLASRILPIRVFSGSTASDQNLSDGLRYAIGRAPIANLSLASTTPIAQAAMQDAVNGGLLLVIAAGNRGLSSPDWPARFATESWARGQIIAVGAVDGSNQIASFSNQAGDARSSFIVAPGVAIPGASNMSNSGRVVMTGTSAASPLVAGAAALVLAHWPYLSAAQVAGVLLNTATDLGAPGVDDVYGWGLLDLPRALQPIGATAIPLASGIRVDLSTAGMQPGPIAGAGLRAAAARGDLIGVALDTYQRAFMYDLGAGMGAAPTLSLERIFGPADRLPGFSRRSTANGGQVIFATDAALSDISLGAMHVYDNRARHSQALAGFAMVEPVGQGSTIAFGTAGMANTWLGLTASDGSGTQVAQAPALGLPILEFMPQHHHVGAGWRAGTGLQLKAGLVSSAGTAPLLAQHGIAGAPTTNANALVLDLSHRGRHGLIGVSAQQMRETSGFLGMYAGDAYRLAFAPVTTAGTAYARLDLGGHWSIAAQYTAASTPSLGNTADSLVSGISNVDARGWALGLARDNWWTPSDHLALTLSQPLRPVAGAVTLDLPTSVDASGAVQRTTRVVSLVPAGRERLVELSYARTVRRGATVGVSLMHRSDPDHDPSARAERVVAVRYALAF